MPAVLVALIAVPIAIAVALVAEVGDGRGDRSSTTSAIVVPISGDAQPSPAPTTGAPTVIVVPTGVTVPGIPATAFAALETTSPGLGVGLAAITPQEVETFVRTYYDAVAAANYDRTWSQLTPEFQRGRALSYDYYVDFWNDNDIEVGNVELVDVNQDRVIVNVELRWNGNSTAETNQFTLRPDENGDLLIASQTTVDD